MRFDGEEDDMTAVMTGIPQGSSESSIIFLLYVKLFFDTLEKTNSQTRCPSYVDDVGLVVIGRNKDTKCRILEEIAKTAFTWNTANTGMFDDAKSELMH